VFLPVLGLVLGLTPAAAPAASAGEWSVKWVENAKLPKPIRQFEILRADGSRL